MSTGHDELPKSSQNGNKMPTAKDTRFRQKSPKWPKLLKMDKNHNNL
jgi:hypothetical protein